MTLYVTQLEPKNEHRSFRLSRPGGATRSEARDDLVLPGDRARDVLAAAARQDVSRGGVFSPGPAGVQVWSGPWNSPTGGPGTAEHLGSVDWSWDTPVTNYVTLYRVMLTAAGTVRGMTPEGVLTAVLALTGVQAEQHAAAAIPLPRDPFRHDWAGPILTNRA